MDERHSAREAEGSQTPEQSPAYEHLHTLLQSLLAPESEDSAKRQQLYDLLQTPEFQPLLTLQQAQSAVDARFITDQMPGGFFIYRSDGDEELLYANRALFRLFGCEDLDQFKALTGFTFKGIVHPDDYEQVEQSIWEQIRDSHFDLDYVEYRIIQRDGSIRWIEDYGHFVHSEATGGLFYVFVADATDKR